jgi:LPXTG-motif cell wall-anchored protein
MRADHVPSQVWALPWESGHANSGNHGVDFSFRKINIGNESYLQIFANGIYNNFVNGAFSATALAGVPAGMGALSDDAAQSAAGNLMTELQSAGCQPGFSQAVQDFQSAYVSAGGQLPNDSNGASGIDGLYGANTQAALQAVLDAGPNQPGQTAPVGCVGTGGGGGGTIAPTQIPSQTITGTVPSTGMSHNAKMALIAAGLVGAGIIGYAIYRKQKKVRVVHLRRV